MSAFVEARDFLISNRCDYATAYRDFVFPRLTHFNWALDYFDSLPGEQLALWIVEEDGSELRLTFAELSARSNRTANLLRRRGVRRGDRVLVMLGNEVALWETMLAAFKLGAVVIPTTPLLGTADLQDRLARGQVRHVVAGRHIDSFADIAGDFSRISLDGASRESALFEPDGPTLASDPLLLYFTSGTTAQPKLVQHSHESYPVGHLSTMYWLGLQPGDVHWNISSPGWAKHAWSCFFAPWNAGATVFIYNYARFHAADALRVLASKPVTSLCAPPTVWRMLVLEDLAAHRVQLREVMSAGEPLNPEVIQRIRAEWKLTVRDGYGQTETTAMVGNPPGQPLKPGSMGRPLPGYRIELTDEGEICLELAARPAGLMLGYTGVPGPADDKFYRTGDVATCDEEGYLTYVGRADDVFKSSDYRISPFELESLLLRHPAVAEAAIVPCEDKARGCVPKAYITLIAGYKPSEKMARYLFSFIRQTFSPFKRIRRIEFCELPKTISGKIRRAELRTRKPLKEYRD
uniref:AMP-dependent synthetase and ligase n=1 Tax=Solibacter usitatus (strain Ellin6076) TaxID=234267 RepID=Q01S59_SOLUE